MPETSMHSAVELHTHTPTHYARSAHAELYCGDEKLQPQPKQDIKFTSVNRSSRMFCSQTFGATFYLGRVLDALARAPGWPFEAAPGVSEQAPWRLAIA